MIGRADINHVLMQMRQTKANMQPNFDQQPPQAVSSTPQPPTAENPAFPVTKPDTDVPSFGDMFANAVNSVNAKQMHASSLQTRFTKGDPMVDLPEVMIAAQKSSVAFQAMTQVRNKMIEAYKDIMNMPV